MVLSPPLYSCLNGSTYTYYGHGVPQPHVPHWTVYDVTSEETASAPNTSLAATVTVTISEASACSWQSWTLCWNFPCAEEEQMLSKSMRRYHLTHLEPKNNLMRRKQHRNYNFARRVKSWDGEGCRRGQVSLDATLLDISVRTLLGCGDTGIVSLQNLLDTWGRHTTNQTGFPASNISRGRIKGR